MAASLNGHAEVVDKLLEKGVSTDKPNENGEAAEEWRAWTGKTSFAGRR